MEYVNNGDTSKERTMTVTRRQERGMCNQVSAACLRSSKVSEHVESQL